MTAVSVLSACASLRGSREGNSVHGYLIRNAVGIDVFVYNALLHMHSKCGSPYRACRIFRAMLHHNAISWTTMITGYASNGCLDEALSMLWGLECSELRLDEVSLLSLISACSESRSSRLVELTLRVLEKSCPGKRKTTTIWNALVSMHAKCGDIASACKVLNEMVGRTVISWTSMIHGLAVHGYGQAALVKFFQMQGEGIDPDEIVFLSVLFACSHSGLIEEGKKCFHMMINHYGMIPSMDHYGCMVDLLCRGGLVAEGFDFVMGMPVEPDMILWRTLLGACLNNGYNGLASEVRNRIRQSGPRSSEDYVILSNSFAMANRWDAVKRVRDEMNKVGANKNDLGYSWIEMKQSSG
ncbi:hypothetical protein MLD38_027971 [Melastoma candidum]|nr:hypothetical protein MLD38_027971 [Melastoma candidum]